MWKRSVRKRQFAKRIPKEFQPPQQIHYRHDGGEAALDDTAFGPWRRSSLHPVMNPRVIFPWRHEEDPLPRLIPGSEEFEQQGSYFGPNMPYLPDAVQGVVTRFTAHQLQVAPWHQLLFLGNWRQDLANTSAFAFSQSVACVMSNLYDVPFDDIRSGDDGEIELKDHTIQKQNECENNHNNPCSPPLMDDMIDEHLRNLYQSAHESGKNQLQINLHLRPTSATLLGAFLVPYITRERVKDDPTLQNVFRNIYLKLLKEEEDRGRQMSTMDSIRFGWQEMTELGRSQIEFHDDHASISSTAVAQVLIHCDEIFSVKDLATEKILQGHGDGKIRQIPHVVRLESIVTAIHPYEEGERSFTESGAWKITDWDDLLGGNIFYV